jgi:hypothetical protein
MRLQMAPPVLFNIFYGNGGKAQIADPTAVAILTGKETQDG